MSIDPKPLMATIIDTVIKELTIAAGENIMDMKPLEVDSVDNGFMTPWSNKQALKSLQSPESGKTAAEERRD